MLVLPPSFPIGGMENPRLTFLTPDHDRGRPQPGRPDRARTGAQLVRQPGDQRVVEALVAERRIYHLCDHAHPRKAVRRRSRGHEPAAGAGRSDRVAERHPAAKQALVTRARTVNPKAYTDEGLAYPKGAWFLRTLEQRAGRAVFDPFLRGWFDQHAFQSVTTEQFVAYLRSNLLNAHPDRS
jgi:leukotriene-A4 hydrolase